jgi:hypothetical protein
MELTKTRFASSVIATVGFTVGVLMLPTAACAFDFKGGTAASV